MIGTYGVEIYLEGDAYVQLTSPAPVYETALGPAVRDRDADSRYFGESIRLTRHTTVMTHMLPPERESINYACLNVSGKFLETEIYTRDPGSEYYLRGAMQFREMLVSLFSTSPSWAVFFLRDYDDIEVKLRLELNEAVETVFRFLCEETEELQGGFCIVSA